MAMGKAMGPGGRIARAENKVEKAKEKVSKAGKNLISSRDNAIEYNRKKAIEGKTMAKVGKAVAKVDKAKAKVEKVTGKVADKAVKQVIKKETSAKERVVEKNINLPKRDFPRGNSPGYARTKFDPGTPKGKDPKMDYSTYKFTKLPGYEGVKDGQLSRSKKNKK